MKPITDICAQPAHHEDREEVFKYAPCLNQNQKQLSTCSEKIKRMFFYLIENNYERRIPIVCCNFRQVQECTSKKTTELCGFDHAQFSHKLSAYINLFDNVCKGKKQKEKVYCPLCLPGFEPGTSCV